MSGTRAWNEPGSVPAVAGADRTGLVGKRDGLRAAAQRELGEHAIHARPLRGVPLGLLTTATHSRNIAVRSQVGIAIFDSHAPIGAGQGVYMSATAEQVSSAELTRRIETFSQRSIRHGGVAWTVGDVQPDSGLTAVPSHAGLVLDPRQGQSTRPSHPHPQAGIAR